MCILRKFKNKDKENRMASSKVLDKKCVPEIQIKNIGFSSHPVTHRVKRMGKNDILLSAGKAEIITRDRMKSLGNRTVKIRFSGVPRARIGEIINDVKSDSSSVYVRTIRSQTSKKIAHYDVLIVRDSNDEN